MALELDYEHEELGVTIPDGLPTTNWDVGWFDSWLTHHEPLSQYITRMNDKYDSYVSDIGGWDWPIE